MIEPKYNSLFSLGYYCLIRLNRNAIMRLFIRSPLDFYVQCTRLRVNNTPPASRLVLVQECSAPRGVTRFWGAKK